METPGAIRLGIVTVFVIVRLMELVAMQVIAMLLAVVIDSHLSMLTWAYFLTNATSPRPMSRPSTW
jgi:hypothetical protein